MRSLEDVVRYKHVNGTFYPYKVDFLDCLPNCLDIVQNELHTNVFLHNHFGNGLKVKMFASWGDLQTKLEFLSVEMSCCSELNRGSGRGTY